MSAYYITCELSATKETSVLRAQFCMHNYDSETSIQDTLWEVYKIVSDYVKRLSDYEVTLDILHYGDCTS